MKHLAAAFIGIGLTACVAPQVQDGAVPATFTARLGQSVRAGPFVVTPVSIAEDSRCPASVQCIQAGTVRLLVRVGTDAGRSELAVELRKPAAINGDWLHLLRVCPYPAKPGPIPSEAYEFTFALIQSSTREPSGGTCGPA